MAADCEEDLEIPLEESPVLVGWLESQVLLEQSYRNRGESQCRVVWQAGQFFYTCSTCGLKPWSAVCVRCFNHVSHEGHKVALNRSANGGFCDCGDPASWRESGFCASNYLHLHLYSSTHEFVEQFSRSRLHGDARFGASSKPSSSPSTTSCYYSARTQSMIENRSGFTSDVEFEIEYSKVHWSEMDLTPTFENLKELNRTTFLDLKNKFLLWQCRSFFLEKDDIVIGKKIGEGGQAEIYEVGEDYVVKIFHPNLSLKDLENQWPQGMLNDFGPSDGRYLTLIKGGMLLKDSRFLDRFAILMERQWGDLRKLIDLQMVERNNQGPPFSVWQVRRLMFCIARNMHLLHSTYPPILHRDLKAANVLVIGLQRPAINGKILATVADYECSVGVVGTGFWRAPEILEQLKNRVRSCALKFTRECDVYSFGMVCYELITGCIPFEGHSLRDYDFILDGNQPKLPEDLHITKRRLSFSILLQYCINTFGEA